MFSASKTKQVVASGPYTLTKSLRLRNSASAYLNRTPSSATNQKTFTFSFWVKRATISGTKYVFTANSDTNASNAFGIDFYNNLEVYQNSSGSAVLDLISTAIYVDNSAWYHVVIAIDTTQATASNRALMYVNGVQITSFSTATYPAQNTNLSVNSAVAHYINRLGYTTTALADQYLTDFYLIDGQQLTPSSFGATDATTGVWQPKAYTGSYGTNGFHLTFANTTSTTTLGYDTSGNGNNFTTNNISLTAGSTYDSMNDVPMLTNATASNYCVLNPAPQPTVSGGLVPAVLSNGNLYSSATSESNCYGTIAVSSGKWYFELTNLNTLTTNNDGVGIANPVTGSWYAYRQNATLTVNGSGSSYGSAWTSASTQVIGVALDMNAGTLTFYLNGTSQGTASTGLTGLYFPFVFNRAGGSSSLLATNFGQQPFVYTPPSGYVALNTYNLPTPAILQGNKYMDATLYTGNGTTQTITNASGFKPDLFWIKDRSSNTSHRLQDTVRGVGNRLASDLTAAENADLLSITSFNSNGFSLGTNVNYNGSSDAFVAWQWQAGQGSSGSNTNGSITSTVSASTTAGFSISTWTGNGANATIGHGLGVVPSMVIIKTRSVTDNWYTYHISTGAGNYLALNSTIAASASSTIWQNTNPTSSVFYLGAGNNTSSYTFVAYCFAPIAGFSAFGSYVGNGSSTGPFVYLGFKPKFIMVKSSTRVTDWNITDGTRNPYDSINYSVNADTSGVETTFTLYNYLSNGFQIITSDTSVNSSGDTYIYMAFASNPFKYSNAY
jgi:hypothetical protein